jgi:WXG100 family type VII secretion target
MAERISIRPEQVRNVAGQFRSKSQESASMVQQLNGSVKGLEAEWVGMSAQRFYGDFTQWSQTMNKYVELLNSIAGELDRIANTIEQTDLQLAGQG